MEIRIFSVINHKLIKEIFNFLGNFLLLLDSITVKPHCRVLKTNELNDHKQFHKMIINHNSCAICRHNESRFFNMKHAEEHKCDFLMKAKNKFKRLLQTLKMISMTLISSRLAPGDIAN